MMRLGDACNRDSKIPSPKSLHLQVRDAYDRDLDSKGLEDGGVDDGGASDDSQDDEEVRLKLCRDCSVEFATHSLLSSALIMNNA